MRSARQWNTADRSRHNRFATGRGTARAHSGIRKRPTAGCRHRGAFEAAQDDFTAPELWHELTDSGRTKYRVQPPGDGYIHPVTTSEVADRIAKLPAHFTRLLEVVQFSGMTRKRRQFPCYGMQWGRTVYLYPIEENLVETYLAPPKPSQLVEARMFGGEWKFENGFWLLTWTPETIRDFYLNNVLIHEIGHLVDERNSNMADREKYANWFAIEYGYRASRGLLITGTTAG
jgi:hypothetical protein